jgi:hypothetical protein
MTDMVEQAVTVGQRASEGMIRDVQEVQGKFRCAIGQVWDRMHRIEDRLDERIDGLENRVNDVHWGGPPPPYPSSADTTTSGDYIDDSLEDSPPANNVALGAVAGANNEEDGDRQASASVVNDLNQAGKSTTSDEYENAREEEQRWQSTGFRQGMPVASVDSGSDNEEELSEGTLTLFEACGEAVRTSTPT